MGMFDSVVFRCPHCGAEVELQSKAGDCALLTYRNVAEVPLAILADLDGTRVLCGDCLYGGTFRVAALARMEWD